jgi:hypothetical protein
LAGIAAYRGLILAKSGMTSLRKTGTLRDLMTFGD